MTKKILFIDACVRGKEISRTYKLCEYALKELKLKYKEVDIHTLTLEEENIAPLNKETLDERERLLKEGKTDGPLFKYAKEFAEADYILVGAPFWDLSFPAVLKAYMETVSICGITFYYKDPDCIGMGKAEKMLYISTVGGYYGKNHLGAEYMKALGEMLGVKSFDFVAAQGLDVMGTDVEDKLEEARVQIRERV